jgi:DNA-binding CsgD family transcriptional regulator
MPAASTAPALPKEFNVLIGTIDVSLRVDRVCADGDTSLDGPMGLVGQSIFQIVHLDDLTGLMWALAQSTSTAKGVALHVHVHRGHGQAQLCQMLLLPMDPPPTFAFALRSVEQSEGWPEPGVDALLGETRGHDVFGSSHNLASISEAQVPGIAELSSRELDVLTRLLAGYRVPAIAKVLFVSQSTVRNHLSAIFRKLNVESQQELIDLLRI